LSATDPSPTPVRGVAALPTATGGPELTLILGALTAFGPLSIDMYLPSLPTLAESFGVSPSRIQLTLSAFLLGFGLGQLVYGPLADRWGRKPPLLAGIGLYVAASLLCALSTGATALIGLRLLQGFGGCAGPMIARAVVRDVYARDRAARTLSLMMLVMGAAPLLAPLAGGQLLLAFGWRSIFGVLAGFGVLCFLVAGLRLPETLDPTTRARASFPVAGYGTLLRDPVYLGYVLSSGAAYAGMFAYFAGSPFVFIRLYHVPAQHYGFLFALNVIGLMVGAAVNGRLVLRVGADRLLRLGVTAVAVAGGALLAAAASGRGGLAGLVIPLLAFIAALSFIGANAVASALAAFPHMAGTASALAGTIQFGLGALSGAAVSAFHDGSAVPMAAVIATAGLASLLAHRLLVRT
jgi:DHA1 family bicyclomycin/chloramphenicol resistance-like MFS transporter